MLTSASDLRVRTRRSAPPWRVDFGLMDRRPIRSGCRSFSVTDVTVWDLD